MAQRGTTDLPDLLEGLPSRIYKISSPFVERTPAHPVEAGRTWTYRQFTEAVGAAARDLSTMSVRPDDPLTARSCVKHGVAVLALAASMAVLYSVPSAATAKPPGQSFSEIEYRMKDRDAFAAEQALVARLAPQGLGVDAARKALIGAGAHYAGADTQGDLRFTYSTMEMQDDILADVMVTVVLQCDGDVIRGAIVQRAP